MRKKLQMMTVLVKLKYGSIMICINFLVPHNTKEGGKSVKKEKKTFFIFKTVFTPFSSILTTMH